MNNDSQFRYDRQRTIEILREEIYDLEQKIKRCDANIARHYTVYSVGSVMESVCERGVHVSVIESIKGLIEGIDSYDLEALASSKIKELLNTEVKRSTSLSREFESVAHRGYIVAFLRVLASIGQFPSKHLILSIH